MEKTILVTFAATSFCCFVCMANDLFNAPIQVLTHTLLGGVFFTGLWGISWAAARVLFPKRIRQFEAMLESEE